MISELTDSKWHRFKDGNSLGQRGSESGEIIEDIEYIYGARITIERNANPAPFAVTLGIYGLLFHTHFTGTESQARHFLNETKTRIEDLFVHLDVPVELQDKAWNETFNNLTHLICEQIS